MISIDEQRKRRKAMEYAIRTIEMEGFTFTEEEKKVFEDIITSPSMIFIFLLKSHLFTIFHLLEMSPYG
ncbi:MAG: antitoxin VbhA family protein [Clostridiales bacterium]|nr:antitoxin VbhA family protein [Clostridiales bacterium]